MTNDEEFYLPEPVSAPERSAIDKMRECPECHSELRIVSNYLGVNGHCGKCKRHYPISMMPFSPPAMQTPPRGLSKVTLVEPDWGRASEQIGEGSNGPIGPRRK